MYASAIFVFDDPEAFRAAFPEARVNLTVTGPGAFQAQLTRIALERLVLLACSESLPRIAHVSLAPDLACVAFPTWETGPTIMDGVNVRMGDILYWAPGERFHARTTGTFHWGSILFKLNKLIRITRAEGLDLRLPSSGWIGRPTRPAIRRLLRLHRRAEQAALNTPHLLRNQQCALELGHSLIEAMTDCLAATDERAARSAQPSHAKIMNRFEDLVHVSPKKLLPLSQLSDAVGVSGRTLRVCCQQHLGMGPSHYLRLRRLNLARRALLQADPADATVREISSRFAFDEPGRFAVVYRTLFGESPSVTLHRG
jgi:AraC-like DNA-binding protein